MLINILVGVLKAYTKNLDNIDYQKVLKILDLLKTENLSIKKGLSNGNFRKSAKYCK